MLHILSYNTNPLISSGKFKEYINPTESKKSPPSTKIETETLSISPSSSIFTSSCTYLHH